MRKCPDCGHENAEGQKFCGECGARLPKPPAEAGAGAALSDNVINRSRIDASQTSAPVSVGGLHVYAGQPGIAPPSPAPEFCAVCGFRVDDPELRCPHCRELVHVGCYLAEERMCQKCYEERAAPGAPVGPAAVPPAHQPEPAQSLPSEVTEHGIDLVLVPEGPFMMGSDDGHDDETPVHEVWLDAYYIGKHPVTNGQYREFVEDTGRDEPEHWAPDHFGHDEFADDDQPVIYVSWDDAAAFCRWLSRETGNDWHLPTEAEWEKAARGTDGRTYPWGDEAPTPRRCNFDGNVGQTTEVGSYPAGVSPYGCHDMAGNVLEWCADWYGDDYYQSSPQRNPTGPVSGDNRVFRGGSWYDSAGLSRSAYRRRRGPANRRDLIRVPSRQELPLAVGLCALVSDRCC